jgi:hypothetical protein
MKKNFFKKLSFVLALAMIVTALAPAAGAFAAKAPKLNASSKYLYLGVDKKDEFDFNISNKVTGWKYLWTSANEDVASVNKKNGLVTAEAAGKTKISVVITDKKGEEVDELTATVTVRDNIKTLTITNLPTDGKVAVGVAHDFNRSYVTVANKTKGSEGVTRWSVSPSEGATISDMGVFTATKAGEYTITARAFQSKSKYTSWLTDATKYASYVTSNEATYKVTVAASMVSAKQVNLKKFDVVFDSAMTKEDITKNLTVKYVLGGTKVAEGIKNVSMSADNKTATIETNYDLSKGMTYIVEYPNMKSVEFVAATAKIEDVVDMAILTKTAQVGKDTKLDIALYNKDGVNIANSELLGRVTTEKTDNNYAYLVTPLVLNMYKLGEVVKLTATFHTYNYKDGKEIGNVSATAEVTCVEVAKEVAGSIHAWTLRDLANDPTNFIKTNTQVFKNAQQQLYVILKGKDANGDDQYTANFGYTGSPSAVNGPLNWKYTSSNDKVVFVSNSGVVYGITEGTAQVVVSYNDVQVGAVDVTVVGSKKAAMAELSTQSLTLSNSTLLNDTVTLSFKVFDQLGNDYKTSGGLWDATTEVTYNGSAATNPWTGTGLDFNGLGKAAGSYNYTVKIKDNNNSGVAIPLTLNVTVQDPGANTTVASYKIESDKTSFDVKSGSTVSTEAVDLKVYAYNSAGVKLQRLTLAALGTTITVRTPDGVTPSSIIVSDRINLMGSKTVSGRNVITNLKTGSWVISSSNASGMTVQSLGFEVKNTQPKAEKTIKTNITDKVGNSISASNIAALINECVSFSAGDKTLYAETGVLGSDYYINGNQVTVRKIKLYERIGGALSNDYIEHEVDLGGVVLYVK